MYEVDRRYLLSARGSLTAAGLLPWRAGAAEVRPRNLIEDPRFPTQPSPRPRPAWTPRWTASIRNNRN